MELLKSLWFEPVPEGTQAMLAYADGGSLEVLVGTAGKIHKLHALAIIAKAPREIVKVVEMRRKLTALTANMATLDASVNAMCS